MNQKRILLWLIGLFFAAIVVFAAFHFDDAVRTWITAHQDRTLKNFMGNVSRFGDWPEHAGLGLLLAGVAWLRGNKKWTRIFLSMLIACALAGVVARVIKIGVGRARPSVRTESVWNGPSLSSKYHAFPSGHTAASTAFFAVLFFASRRIALACSPVPILIAFSRMYVAAHYLSDVVFAAILGLACAGLVARFAFAKTRARSPSG